MSNLNGKFDASTVKAYTRINLIKRDSYESKKSATNVLTKRSAKALSLVKSGFDKRFGSKKKNGESNNEADATDSTQSFEAIPEFKGSCKNSLGRVRETAVRNLDRKN
jgi:hypothetical protein